MSERRFVLADFTYLGRECCSRPYEAGRVYALPRAVAHALELVNPEVDA